MTAITRSARRSRIWFLVALVFALINLAGACMAAIAGEVLHFSIHLVLFIATTPFVWWLAPRRRTSYDA